MIKRVFVDVVIGAVLAIVGQFVQLGAGIVGELMGLPFPYHEAPEDGSIPPDLLTQINLQFALAAVGMLVLTFVIALVLKTRGVGEGVQRGAVWLAVVALSQFLLSLGEGVVPVFGLVGTYVYFAGILLGPILAGLLGQNRPRS